MLASSIGLRANATAMAVPSSISRVSAAATASGRNGSWGPSTVQAPEYPSASSSAAARPASTIEPVSMESIFMPGDSTSAPRQRLAQVLIAAPARSGPKLA